MYKELSVLLKYAITPKLTKVEPKGSTLHLFYKDEKELRVTKRDKTHLQINVEGDVFYFKTYDDIVIQDILNKLDLVGRETLPKLDTLHKLIYTALLGYGEKDLVFEFNTVTRRDSDTGSKLTTTIKINGVDSLYITHNDILGASSKDGALTKNLSKIKSGLVEYFELTDTAKHVDSNFLYLLEPLIKGIGYYYREIKITRSNSIIEVEFVGTEDKNLTITMKPDVNIVDIDIFISIRNGIAYKVFDLNLRDGSYLQFLDTYHKVIEQKPFALLSMVFTKLIKEYVLQGLEHIKVSQESSYILFNDKTKSGLDVVLEKGAYYLTVHGRSEKYLLCKRDKTKKPKGKLDKQLV